MRRVRRGRGRRATGFILTWDVDSADHSAASRLRRFLYGSVARYNGREYRYRGFVEREGVRYLGQSVVFVVPLLLGEIDAFLTRLGVDHEIIPASLG